MTQNIKLKTLSDKLESWLKNESIPLWATKGIEQSTGGSYERLTNNGDVDLNCDRRVRVNYRQIYVFSQASELGWLGKAQGKKLVEQLHQFVEQYGANNAQKGTYAHLLNSQGNIIDGKQDTYDLAFYLLSCAWRYSTFNDNTALQQADAMISNLDRNIKGIKGGWLEGDYAAPHRRQNPHMHVFEAFMALYDATQQAKWLARAGQIFSMFESHFYNSDQGIILEYFNADWSPQFGTNGKVVEPGHMMEWVWLLHEYSDKTGVVVDKYVNVLYENALSWGKNSEGLLYDEVNEIGTVIKQTKRCWPMTELIKASIAQAKHTDDLTLKASYENNAAIAIETLLKFYLAHPVAGCYFDQLDEENQVISEFSPASTLYHLVLAAREVIHYCNKNKELQKAHV